MRKYMAALVLILAFGLMGCGQNETAQIHIPSVETVETSEKESLLAETEMDLGEEEVIFMQEGVPQSQTYKRIRGRDTFSIAYNPEQFAIVTTEKELRFESLSYGMESDTPVFVSIREEAGETIEEVADRYVKESNEECSVEELTVGEGEYPAVWIFYAEGVEADSRTCDIYVLRCSEKIYVVQMDCFLEAYEGLGASQALILSTLRFDEG